MMNKNRRFVGVQDPKVIGRISRSQDIRTVKYNEQFVAVNLKNGNKYKVHIEDNTILCTCFDAQKGNNCKHEIAVARDLRLFEEVTP